jgi:hypothetical protein
MQSIFLKSVDIETAKSYFESERKQIQLVRVHRDQQGAKNLVL